MRTPHEWVTPEPQPNPGCVLALGLCLLFWGIVLAMALFGEWLC